VDIAATRSRIYEDRNRYGLPGSNAAGRPAVPGAAPQPRPQVGNQLPAGAEQSELVGEMKGSKFVMVSPTGQPVVGFHYVLFTVDQKQSIRFIDPMFSRTDPPWNNNSAIKALVAKEGYVVAGLTVEKKFDHMAIRVLFARYVDGQTRRSDTYESEWIGDVGGYERRQLGDGTRAVIGTFGSRNLVTYGIGVVFSAAEGRLPAGTQ